MSLTAQLSDSTVSSLPVMLAQAATSMPAPRECIALTSATLLKRAGTLSLMYQSCARDTAVPDVFVNVTVNVTSLPPSTVDGEAVFVAVRFGSAIRIF